MAVAGLIVLGFGLGIALLILAPMIRAGRGPFAFLNRPGSQVLDARRLGAQPAQAVPTRVARPELWRTPVALMAFPNDQAFTQVASAPGAVRVVYQPDRSGRVIPLPAIQDALGRSLLFVVATLGADDDTRTPGPFRPDPLEVTEVTLLASGQTDGGDPSGCLLSLGGAKELRTTGTLGSATIGDCQEGTIPMPGGQAVAFRLRYDMLPNYRGQDGAWRDGGVLGRTEIVATTVARDVAGN